MILTLAGHFRIFLMTSPVDFRKGLDGLAGVVAIYRHLQKVSAVITTYDTMVNDIAIISPFEWSWVIGDEAQAIKNLDSNRRKAIVTIPRRRAIPITGTPVRNTLLDLWSLTDFAIPGMVGDRSTFELEFPDTVEAGQALGRITDPIILRRRVADVANDLPERIDIDLPLEFDDRLVDHYNAVRTATMEKYLVAGALVATLQLQLVCAHSWLRQTDVGDVDAENAMIERGNSLPLITPKMDRTVELLRETFANGRKVIVFALFNRIGDLVREACRGFLAAYWGAINGSTPQEDRQTIIGSFDAHDGPACLILNPKAAGAGLNITAATVVIRYTPAWNPALEAQASARAHRRGQTEPVTVYRLFYKDTVEKVMIDRSSWKSELANETVPVSSRDADDRKRDGVALCGEVCRLVEVPRHEVFAAALRLSVADGAPGGGEMVDRVHVGHLAGSDQRGEHGPVLGADFISGEQRILSCQGDWSDLVLDRVGVEFQHPVLEEADQARPVRQGVADVLSQLGLSRGIRESRASSHGFSVALIGAACSRRAARRTAASFLRTDFSI